MARSRWKNAHYSHKTWDLTCTCQEWFVSKSGIPTLKFRLWLACLPATLFTFGLLVTRLVWGQVALLQINILKTDTIYWPLRRMTGLSRKLTSATDLCCLLCKQLNATDRSYNVPAERRTLTDPQGQGWDFPSQSQQTERQTTQCSSQWIQYALRATCMTVLQRVKVMINQI